MSQIRVELQATYGSDREVAEAAWTSSLDYTKKKKRTDEDVAKVIEFLADHKHSTPFESIIFRFWIKMPIATDRQFMTHRIQSSSGMSGRYRTMPREYYDVPDDVHEIMNKIPMSQQDKSKLPAVYGSYNWLESYYDLCESANHHYEALGVIGKEAERNGLITNTEFKRIREFYRGVLPQHNMTERVSIMNLRAFANFIRLRNSEHAQPEIREVAKLMLQSVKSCDTVIKSIEALEKNNWNI